MSIILWRIFGLLAFLLISTGLGVKLWRRSQVKRRIEITLAEVVDIVACESKPSICYPVLKAGSCKIQYRGPVPTDKVNIGDTVEVLYNPMDFSDCEVREWLKDKSELIYYVCVSLGTVFLILYL